MASKQMTFWNATETKRSLESHEHVTLRFTHANRGAGRVYKLSRDKAKSVKKVWVWVGTWNANEIKFNRESLDLAVAATHLQRNGWDVYGCWIYDSMTTTARETKRITNPDTLNGTADTQKDRVGRNRNRQREKVATIDLAAAMAARRK